MRRYLCIGLVFLLAVSLFSGCGGTLSNVNQSTVYVQKKGTVLSADIEELGKEYYKESELEDYIADQVEAYQKEHGDRVFMESFSVEEGVAKLMMKYVSYEDYQDFNDIELYSGNVVRAQADGYDFNTEFAAVSGNEKTKASKEEVLSADDCNVVVIRANIDVRVDGTILFVSDSNTIVTGKNTVSIIGEEPNEEAELTYIIYR